MAILLNPKIVEILKKENQPEEITRAISHDKRAVFHTEPTMYIGDIPYYKDFIQWVGEIIDKNKLDVFKHLMTLPIDTVDFTEGVYNELTKIFNAKDRFINHQFTNSDLEKDYDEYLDSIKDDEFWKTKGFQAMKSAINSILIVDLPREMESTESRPEPYYYLLPIEKVVSFEMNDRGEFEYIIFKDANMDNVFHAFDDMNYRTYVKDDKGNYELIVENIHVLEYTPARTFWSTPFNNKSKIQKKAPISNALSRLDWLLCLYVFKKHTELYAGFPVDIMYEQQCSYQDDQGNICEKGYITKQVKTTGHSPDAHYEPLKEPCPACNGNKPMLGAGTVLTAPARADKDDADLIDGLNRVGADVDSLKRLEEDIMTEERRITWNMIGYVQEQSKEAMNELQIAGNVESRQNVIMQVKSNFEKIHLFAVKTIGKLRYNTAYLGTNLSYGEKFYFNSLIDLKTVLEESRKNGMPNFEISNQQKQLLFTKYRDNPEMLDRVTILTCLEPLQGYTLDEIININKNFTIDPLKVDIKVNFNEYIKRFELEFTNIVTFMQFSDFEEKIEFINLKLLDYAEESQSITESRSDARPDDQSQISPIGNGGGDEDSSE